ADPACAGKPPHGVTLRVVDEQGRDAAPGEPGRIFVGSGLAFGGYTDGSDKARLDGLVATGDLGVLDDADTLRAGGRDLVFPVYLGGAYLLGVDSSRTAVVGTSATGLPTAVAVTVGRGRAVVLSTPVALTNAALAGEGDAAAYLAAVFAYVPPVRRVFWDDTYKPLREGGGSLFRYAARTPALRWALGTLFLGALLAVVSLGRRRQRPIPVVAPPPNAQREFARTVGRLFFVRGDRAWLARRKLRLFEDALRTRLGVADADLSDPTAARAAARAGVPEDEARALFARLRDLSTDPSPSAAALLAADREVDAFLAARDAAARDGDPHAAPTGLASAPAAAPTA
ncbi:MAG TPA: hypothetical protein VF576_00860, partial [Rubricoccaceae bacterium]